MSRSIYGVIVIETHFVSESLSLSGSGWQVPAENVNSLPSMRLVPSSATASNALLSILTDTIVLSPASRETRLNPHKL